MARKLDTPAIGVTIRLTHKVIDRLELYRKHLQTKTPGLTLTMSNAAQIALVRTFDEEEIR